MKQEQFRYEILLTITELTFIVVFCQSDVWIEDPTEKKKLIEDYKTALK